jgi:putative transposase
MIATIRPRVTGHTRTAHAPRAPRRRHPQRPPGVRTNYRRPAFTDPRSRAANTLIREVCACWRSAARVHRETHHVPLLVHHPPRLALSVLVNRLTGVSSRRPRQRYPSQVRKYLWGTHCWSPAYFAASRRGAPPTAIKQHIQQHNRPDSTGPLRGPTHEIGFLPAANRQASAEKWR